MLYHVTNTAAWAAILGVLLPLITAVVQQPRWSPRARALVGGLAAVVVGVLTCLANGTLGAGVTPLVAISLVLVASQAAYQMWKPSGVTGAIERATSPGSSAPETYDPYR